MSVFSDKLTYLMKRNDMSDDQLGNLVGVNRTTVSRWRTGERSPKMEKLPEIAGVFKVDPRIFVGEVPDNDITHIYNKLTPARKDIVYHFAEQQLEEQNTKIVALPKKEKDPLEVRAAHIDDDATDEERQEAYDFIDSLEDED